MGNGGKNMLQKPIDHDMQDRTPEEIEAFYLSRSGLGDGGGYAAAYAILQLTDRMVSEDHPIAELLLAIFNSIESGILVHRKE